MYGFSNKVNFLSSSPGTALYSLGLHDIRKNSHCDILFFCNIYCDMKKKKKNHQMILISICKKKINDWGDFIGE